MADTKNVVIDSDGHVFEDNEEIISRLRIPKEFIGSTVRSGLFPPSSHVQYRFGRRPEGAFGVDSQGRYSNPGPDGWIDFMDTVGISSALLFPTQGQRIGRIVNREYAIALAQAYNEWLAETYLDRSTRFRGVAILPMHDPEAAVEELHRAVTELRMSAALIPATGVHLDVTHKQYWPLLAEAARLGCPLAVHGGGHWDLGMETVNVGAVANALGHPVSIMIVLGNLIFNGLFDRYPDLRVCFLEGGVSWLLTALERFDRAASGVVPFNPRGEVLELPEGQTMRDYVIRLLRDQRISVGMEGDEHDLPYALESIGHQPFMFSSDFPHEVNADLVSQQIQNVRDLTTSDESAAPAILGGNAAHFFRI
jgi:predicted TIM-barrel fold metal-dependent hydrolase